MGEDVFNLLSQFTVNNTENELLRRRKEAILSDVLGISSSVYKTADASKRLRELKREANKLKKPKAIAKRTNTRSVAEALDKARQLVDRPLSPLEMGAIKSSQIEQLRQDQENNRIAATGNAATFGALSQASGNRMRRERLGMQAGLMGARNEALRNFNYATQADVNDRAGVFRDNLFLNRQALDQYNTESEAIGRAIASSRLSRMQGLDSLINPLSRLGSRADVSNFFENINLRSNNVDMMPMPNAEMQRGLNFISQGGLYGLAPTRPKYDYSNLGSNIADYEKYVNNVNINQSTNPYNPLTGQKFYFDQLDN